MSKVSKRKSNIDYAIEYSENITKVLKVLQNRNLPIEQRIRANGLVVDCALHVIGFVRPV